MTRLKKLLIPIAIITATIVIMMAIFSNPPSNKRFKGKPQAQMTVDALTLTEQDFSLDIQSYGVVRPRTQSMLVAQVSGQVSFISENFRDGGFFEEGELLLSIDDRDYQAEVKIAEASLLSAKQNLLEEQARSKQALADWNRLGSGDAPSPLVLREPQLAAQQASVLSAQAKLEKAQIALERTKLIAPFAGRVLNKNVDLGQVVSNNSQLASIYATDYVEIRLPINNKDLPFINLPETYRSGEQVFGAGDVELSSDLVGEQRWQGHLVRTEGAIDDGSQQLYVIAQINDPYNLDRNIGLPIKIGQYVTARIKGKIQSGALVIPNNAIYQGSYVYTLTDDNLLIRKDVTLAWQNDTQAIVKSGLESGMRLVTTSLGQVSSGTKVAVLGEAPKSKKRGKISPEQREKLQKIADKRGISVEQLVAERKQKRVESEL